MFFARQIRSLWASQGWYPVNDTGSDQSGKDSKIENWVAIIGAVILAGVIMYASFWQVMNKDAPKTDTINYNGFKFEHIEGMWYTKWQKGSTIYSVPLRFNPEQVQDVKILGSLDQSFNRPQMYISFDPSKGNFSVIALAAGELSLSMVRALGVTPIAACRVNHSACMDRPIITCPTPNATVIMLENEGDPAIWLKGDCVSIRGSGLDLVKSVDRLLYSWYGIIK